MFLIIVLDLFRKDRYQKMTNVASADFTDIGSSFSDILNLSHQAIHQKEKFLTFMTPSLTSSWEWEPGMKSLVFMFLSSFGITWEMLISKIKEQHGENELNAVVNTYGRLLACLITENSPHVHDRWSGSKVRQSNT